MNAQSNNTFECGFKPTASQIQHYRSQLPVATSLSNLSVSSTSNYAIHVWVIRNATGTNITGPTAESIETEIAGMSANFNFSNGAHFVLCGITYINDDVYTNGNSLDVVKSNAMYNKYNKPNAINCYILGSYNAGATAPYPGDPFVKPAIVFNGSGNFKKNIMTHEMGHFFGLFHTFADQGRTEELVTRGVGANCDEIGGGGDYLCDTPADPQACRAGCGIVCNPNLKDANGASYMPDYQNYMSYHALQCWSRFSVQQQNKMNLNLPARAIYLQANCPTTPTISSYGEIRGLCSSGWGETDYALDNTVVTISTANNSIVCQTPFNATLTGQFGIYYSCELPTNQIINIKPKRNTTYLNGVTTADISLITEHILDINVFNQGISPTNESLTMLSADVNNDGEIDATDILYIRKLILNQISVFPNQVGSWRFVPKRYLANANFLSQFQANPFTACYTEGGNLPLCYITSRGILGDSYMDKVNLDLTLPGTKSLQSWSFHPIKMGDVQCNAVSTLRLAPLKLNANRTISLNSNEEKVFLLKAKYAGKVSSFQMGLNTSNLNVLSVEKGDFDRQSDEFDFSKQPNGELRALWYDSKGKDRNLTNGITLMKLKVKSSTNIADILTAIKLDANILSSEFYDEKGNNLLVALSIESDGDVTPIPTDANTAKAYPNPFTNEVNFEIASSTKENASISITNSFGIQIYTAQYPIEIGSNLVTISNTANFPLGVLSYTIKLKNKVLNGYMTKTR